MNISMHGKRNIGCTIHDNILSLDAVGPMQVFASANAERAQQGLSEVYQIRLLADEIGPVRCSAGMALVADTAREQVNLAEFDTILVPGGPGVYAQLRNRALIEWIRRARTKVRRLGSVCSGALLLAEAGLLDGREATTHWSVADALARRYPNVLVNADRLHTYDAKSTGASQIFTAAGVTSGIDLALALVEADLGRELALNVARNLVMYLHRPGGQSQYSGFLAPECSKSSRLAPLLQWLPGNLEKSLSAETLAEQAGLPVRTLARIFQRELGMSPAQYVDRIRVETAALLLSQERPSVAVVATMCGFNSGEILRRSFHKHFGVSPSEYSQRFGSRVEPTQEVSR